MRIEVLFERLRTEFLKVNLIQAIIDSLIVFLTFNLLTFVFKITLIEQIQNWVPLTVLSVVFFGLDWYWRSRNYSLEIYEEKNPEMKEILRTARDRSEDSNIVAQALFDEVVDRSRKMTSETIIPTERILQKITVVGILSFLTVITGMTGLQVEATSAELLDSPSFDPLSENKTETKSDFKFTDRKEVLKERRPINLTEMNTRYSIEGEGALQDRGEAEREVKEPDIGFSEFSGLRSQDQDLALAYMKKISDIE